ncbi:hypothetical protein SCYAM73S_03518 [Streptomyces cyaneofuscatus]
MARRPLPRVLSSGSASITRSREIEYSSPVDGELFQDRGAHVGVGAGGDQGADDVRGRPHPADPHPGPERLAGRADGEHRAAGRVEGADPAGHGGVGVQPEFGHRLVDDQDGAGGAGGVDQVPPLLLVGEGAGRVVEVGHHIGEPGRGVPQRLAPPVHVPAADALLHRDRDEAGARLTHQLEDVGVRRGLDRDPFAAACEEVADGVDGTHRAGGDHDLFGHGRDAERGVAVGDRLSQRGQPGRVVAVRVGIGRQLLHRPLEGAGQPGLGGGQRGAAEVDHRAERLRGQRFEAPGGQRVPGRDGGPAARAAPRLQEPLRAQRLVGGGDGGAADGEGEGEFTFGGQPGGDRDPALQHQQPYAVGERAVGGGLPSGRAGGPGLLRLELPRELSRPHRRSPLRHRNQSTFLELAMVGDQSPATG